MWHTPTEQQNSIDVAERYHGPLDKVFQKLPAENPSLDKHTILQLSVYDMNTTVNPFVLIPIFLVFGQLIRLVGVPGTGLLPQTRRLAMLQTGRDEDAKWVPQGRIALGLKKKARSAADDVCEVGDMVYVSRETPCSWTCPFSMLGINVKNVTVKVDSKVPKPFSVSRVKRAVTPLDVRWKEVPSRRMIRGSSRLRWKQLPALRL